MKHTVIVPQNNVATGAAATHRGKMPSASKSLADAAAGHYGRTRPTTPGTGPQTGHRNDLPGQR